MLKLNFETGTAWTKSIELEGNKNDDILQLIDDYYIENNKTLPLRTYTLKELEEIYENDENEIDRFIPVNGGEIYIDPLVSIEEI